MLRQPKLPKAKGQNTHNNHPHSDHKKPEISIACSERTARKPRHSILSAFLIGVEKTTSALKAMRCASIVIPALKSWKTPERPAPSLLQDVLILAIGCKNDWSG
ncbi:hypothetical protein [Bartonella gabonensis]|uniref:hypothetical protein n=1 Tax=Bartonella gabonensis TaxID=2699889 RepID=UPI00158A2E74|nr:hypothetical protein [Bartonella gabonensis]